MLTRTEGVWREDGIALIPTAGPFSRSAEFYLALDFFQVNLDDLHKPKEYPAALRWFTGTTRELWGFLWTCDVLDLEPSTTRRAILRHHMDPLKLARHPPDRCFREQLSLCPVLSKKVKELIWYRNEVRRKKKRRAA
jgi:hypothetical protein